MKFSIVTPTFNSMPILPRCIGSVRGQRGSFTLHHHIQDGGSSDNTAEWLQARTEALDRPEARLTFESARDNGMYDAINRGWQRSDGDVLSWLNSDEQYLPGTLQYVMEAFVNNQDIDVVYGNFLLVNRDGRPLAARREIPLRKFYVANSFLYAASCTLFYRRKLWDEGLLNLDTRYKYSADADLILRLLSRGVRFLHLNRYLSLFTVRGGENLSFRPEMAEESLGIKRLHGGFSSPVARRSIQAMRWMERVFSGCYRKDKVHYLFAINETPELETQHSDRLGFRWNWDKLKNV